MKNVCALGGKMKPTAERYRYSRILMSFIHIVFVPHLYQRNELIHHAVVFFHGLSKGKSLRPQFLFFIYFVSVLITWLKIQ